MGQGDSRDEYQGGLVFAVIKSLIAEFGITGPLPQNWNEVDDNNNKIIIGCQ